MDTYKFCIIYKICAFTDLLVSQQLMTGLNHRHEFPTMWALRETVTGRIKANCNKRVSSINTQFDLKSGLKKLTLQVWIIYGCWLPSSGHSQCLQRTEVADWVVLHAVKSGTSFTLNKSVYTLLLQTIAVGQDTHSPPQPAESVTWM